MKRKTKPPEEGFELIPESVGIIIDSIWINKEKQEIIIKSAYGGQWHWKQQESK